MWLTLKRSIALLLLALLLAGCAEGGTDMSSSTPPGEAPVEYITFDNMSGVSADDPYVVAHEGSYYYCWSEAGGIFVAQIDHPADVDKEKGIHIYDGRAEKMYDIWAPELHFIQGKWYIYAAMCQGKEDNALHRMYCLEATGDSPLEGFQLKGQVTDSSDRWAIDGTVFTWKDQLYTIWSGWPASQDGAQNLYIAHMENPWTIDSRRVVISRPGGWDSITKNPVVNEGPCVVMQNGRLYCLFSGNGSWTNDYCVGYLTLTGDDPLDPKAWVKSEAPILKAQPKSYGPGHCSVVPGGDGHWYILYHANQISGSGWNGRSFRIQRLEFTQDGIAPVEQAASVQVPVARKS